jgi:hypothetical protein
VTDDPIADPVADEASDAPEPGTNSAGDDPDDR